jgi:MFS family permease
MRTFLIIWLGELISLVGSGMTNFALAVWIFERTGQATPFAIAVLLGNLPRILLSPVAGSLADRWNRRWLMILADSGDALVSLSAAILVLTGRLEVWHVYLIAGVSSTFAAFQEPAYTASVSMLVPKKNLARASGLTQLGQSIEMILAPVLAGLLFVAIGLQGIILIDFATYFFAIGALLIVRIPQPRAATAEEERAGSFWADALYGWSYLRARTGLFGLLLFYALVNFLLNFAAVLTGPLVLSFGSPAVLGAVQTASGLGMLIGSLVMSAWGGPRRRIRAVIGFIALASVGLVLAGLQPSAVFVGAGLFALLFCVPLASGPSQAIFQSKVAPAVQGRVFAMRILISRSMMPLAFLAAGPLADRVFEGLMRPGGALADTFVAGLIGAGPGRGIGLMFILSGIALAFATILAYANPRIRNVEEELPDALPEEEPAPAVAEERGALQEEPA